MTEQLHPTKVVHTLTITNTVCIAIMLTTALAISIINQWAVHFKNRTAVREIMIEVLDDFGVERKAE